MSLPSVRYTPTQYVLTHATAVPTAAGGTAVPFKRSTGSISQPATISSIQEEVPRERSVGTNTMMGHRGKNFQNGPSADNGSS